MWIRTNSTRLFNLDEVRSFSVVELKDEEGNPVWALQAHLVNDKSENWYVSKEKDPIMTAFENLETVVGAGRVINLEKKEETESNDA